MGVLFVIKRLAINVYPIFLHPQLLVTLQSMKSQYTVT